MTAIRLGTNREAVPPLSPQPSALGPYIGKRPFKPRFWLRLIRETFGQRRVMPLIDARMASERVCAVQGLECIPNEGAFILAANHYSGRAALDTVAAVLSALSQARPDAVDNITIVIGQKRNTPKNRVQALAYRIVVRLLDAGYARWQTNIVRIPLKNPEPSPSGLRDWRRRNQPMFVFPEGRASVPFGSIRRGAGRWLAALDLPVVPVAIWWMEGEGWTVRFGSPLEWTPRPDLRDVQLGLAMASLLPPTLASAWQSDLARWRAAHESR
jgi:1-acyl-sn-glycerol-3-phosphate acyltransferase